MSSLPEFELVDQYELLAQGGGRCEPDAEEIESGEEGDEEDTEAATSGGGKYSRRMSDAWESPAMGQQPGSAYPPGCG